jgi:Flp pilus assembly protein TadD
VWTWWPSGLAVAYPLPESHSGLRVVGSGLLLGILSVAACLQLRARPYLFVGWFWFIGTLVPVIGLVQVGAHARADRYMYLPQIGLTIAVAWALRELIERAAPTQRARWLRVAAVASGLSCTLALGAAAHQQASHWRDSRSLFERAVRVMPRNPTAHAWLADALLREGELEGAERHYRKASELSPSDSLPVVGLADVLVSLDRPGQAVPQFERALRLDPDDARAHTNLGLALVELERFEQARLHLERALALYSAAGLLGGRGASPHLGLAVVSVARGAPEAAVQHYRAAMGLAPERARPHVDLAMLLISLGRFAEASQELSAAARKGDRSPDLAAGRGVLAEQQGRFGQAAALYRSALAERPGWTAISNNLAWVLATTRDEGVRSPAEAIALAEASVAGTQDPGLLDTLAAAYASAGRYEEAVLTQDRAAKGARSLGAEELAAELEARLALYRSGRPYFDPREAAAREARRSE